MLRKKGCSVMLFMTERQIGEVLLNCCACSSWSWACCVDNFYEQTFAELEYSFLATRSNLLPIRGVALYDVIIGSGSKIRHNRIVNLESGSGNRVYLSEVG